jgi:DNA-binding IclR family transcriptional regulator
VLEPETPEVGAAAAGTVTSASADRRPGVPAVLSAISILHHLQDNGNRPLTMTEFSRDLGLNGSTCFNLLRTLADYRLLSYDPDTRRYSLGLALVELAAIVDDHGKLVEIAKAHADRVARELGQVCLILRKATDGSFLVVGKAEGTGNLRVTASVGDRFPPNGAVLAKAYYAWCPEDQVARMLARDGLPARSNRSITNYGDFKRELIKVRVRGYSTSISEYLPGHNAVGAAVVTPDGTPSLLLVVTGFAALITPEQMPYIGARLVQAAGAIAREVYGRPRPKTDDGERAG